MRSHIPFCGLTGSVLVAAASAVVAACSGGTSDSGNSSGVDASAGSKDATVTVVDAATAPVLSPTSYEAPNVVFIIADDMGGADLDLYAKEWGNTTSDNIAVTPNIDELASEGVRFLNFYTNPICSPTRATLYTGRYGCETTVGDIVSATQTTDLLALSEPTISKDIVTGDAGAPPYTYVNGLFGKWHLGETSPAGGLEAPVAQAWTIHKGVDEGDVPSFTNWTLRTTTSASDTTTVATTTYATLQNETDAVAFVESAVGAASPTNSKRFVLTMAFNAPHTPFHVPPNDPDGSKTYSNRYVSSTTDCTATTSARYCYLADEEALDFYIGRLIGDLATLGYTRSTNTMFIFMSDNGSPSTGATNVIYDPIALANKGKDSAYEGGIREPLIVVGPRVDPSLVGSTTEALVNSSDIYATIRDLVANRTRATTLSSKNSVSVVPYLDTTANDEPASATWAPRSWVYIDDFDGNAPYTETKSHEAVRDSNYKYIVNYDAGVKSYGLFDVADIHNGDGGFVDYETDALNLLDPASGELATPNAALETERNSLSSVMSGVQAHNTSALP